MTPREALEALVKKIDETVNSPEFEGIFTFAHAHGVVYRGPQFGEELEDAREVLAQEATGRTHNPLI